MNERIEHCLYQAGLTAQGCWDELDDYARQGIEKFAELIIKECIDKTFDSEKGIGTTRWKTEVMAELKEHFGVEYNHAD